MTGPTEQSLLLSALGGNKPRRVRKPMSPEAKLKLKLLAQRLQTENIGDGLSIWHGPSAQEYAKKLDSGYLGSLNKVASVAALAKELLSAGAKGAGVLGAAILPYKLQATAVKDALGKMPTEAEANSEANQVALAALIDKIRKDKVNLNIEPGTGIAPCYSGRSNTIYYDPEVMPLHAGVLAHEMGHAKVNKKLKDIFGGNVGGFISTTGSGLIGNVAGKYATEAALIGALAGGRRGAKRIGLIGALAQVPRLMDETAASWWGDKFLSDRGLEGGEKAFSGLGTYAASTAAPLLPWASLSGSKAILRLLSKGKIK